MTIGIRICDACGERHPTYKIKFSRTPNGDPKVLEFCGHCLDDIAEYIDLARGLSNES